ncbi:hypothetical protein [Candidatus Nanohalovita haloferacivicina]|uniref:hypothetical protein n=1 Tax=Candidatus Nanohalovita haloferacivicina TaxID=2978046 RepID=UPI00325FA3B7
MGMHITEEVDRRRLTLKVEDPEEVYSSMKMLLEDRIKFSSVNEEKYYNDVDGKDIRAKIVTVFGMDHLTHETMEIFLHIDREASELDIQLKAKLETEYPTHKSWQDSLIYYAYRSLYDKFLYGETREGYEHAVEERVDLLMDYIKDDMEADYSG